MSFQWPGYVPWKEPRPGNYTDQYPTHYSFAPTVEKVAKSVIGKFPGVSLNTYHKHPPPAPQYERVSMDVWGPRGRGDRLDPAIGQKVFDYLFALPDEPDIEWAVYRGHMWVRGQGWQPSPPGPSDSDPRHDHHIHISYGLKYDTPKGDDPMTKNVLWGVDLSSHQGNISHAQIRREGYTYAICKATEGTYYIDTYYAKNFRDAEAAGLIPGAYHFLTNENVWQQVDKFLATVGRVEGKLIALDVEDPNWPAQYGNGSPSATDVWNAVHYLHEKTGGHPILIYSGYWFWGDRLGNPDIGSLVKDKNCRLWVSRYVSGRGYGSSLYESVPAAWWEGKDRGGFGGHKPTILQFTESALVAGQYIDANAFRGTRAELLKLTGKHSAPKPPEPDDRIWEARIRGLRKKQAENIAKAHRKHGRDAEVVETVKAKEIEMSALQEDGPEHTLPLQGRPGPQMSDQETNRRLLESRHQNIDLTAPNAQQLPAREPQNQPVSHGPSNKGPQDEETALRPTRKVSAAVAGGAISTIVLYVLSMYGVEPPPELGAAIATLVALVLGYLVPEGQ